MKFLSKDPIYGLASGPSHNNQWVLDRQVRSNSACHNLSRMRCHSR